MLLGKIIGKATTTQFQFLVTSAKTRKFQFIQISHADYGFVLGQVMELERSQEEMIGRCSVIGYKDSDGNVKGIRTPFTIGTEILEAEDSFIQNIIELDGEGAFIGTLEGKDIKINMDLQKMLTKHLCVLAKSGAGKSYAVSCLIEEILEKKVPILIIDPHGEYSSLKYPSTQEKERLQELGLEPKGYSAHLQEYGDPKVKEDLKPLRLNEKMSSYELMKMLPLQLSNTQESLLFSVLKDVPEVNLDNILLGLQQLNSSNKWGLIDTIMYLRNLNLFSANYTPFRELISPGKCSIINLKGIAPEVQEVIVYKLLKDLFAARKEEKVPPFFCVLEEAHNFVPEKGFGKAKSSEVIRLISSEGRKFGLGLCIISQRPALVQKTVLAQCSTQIILKVTNPNDLRAIVGSIEGITPETEEEIQNLPIGSALVCGIVDRPLVVKIRPRRTQHGGRAIDILGTIKEEREEEYHKNIVDESKKFEDEGLLLVIKPYMSRKDLQLMSTQQIQKITTYLIPAVFFNCQAKGINFNLLVDKIKGRVILDPEKDESVSLQEAGVLHNFLRKPMFESVEFDIQLPDKIYLNELKSTLEMYCQVIDFKECFIIFHKVLYTNGI